jgi:hypothetical protein
MSVAPASGVLGVLSLPPPELPPPPAVASGTLPPLLSPDVEPLVVPLRVGTAGDDAEQASSAIATKPNKYRVGIEFLQV